MLHRPLSNGIEIPTRVLRVQLRPRQGLTGQGVECEEADVCVALDVETQDLQAVVRVHAQLLGVRGQSSTDCLVVLLVGHLAQQVHAVQLVEDFQPYAVPFHAGLGVRDF